MPGADEKPAIDAIMQKVLEAVPFQLSTDDGIEALRETFRNLPRLRLHPELQVEEHEIDGPAGVIPVRIYWPSQSDTDGPPPLVMYFHGGGFAVGDLDTHDSLARLHAVGARAVVVSVDYRLAPEHPYPAAVEDCWAATQWAVANGAALDTNPSRLAVAGDSAGANLAAVVAQLARDAGLPLAFQLLWYPATMLDTSLPSFTENADAPVLDTKSIVGLTDWYAPGIDLTDPPAGLAPGRAENLADLAPAYIAVAGHDPLRDDGIRYADLLADAGGSVTLHHAETLMHGYAAYAPAVPAATEAVQRGIAALKAALHST